MLEGRHYQNAYVTRNIDKWSPGHRRMGGVRSVAQFEAATEVLTAAGRRPHKIKLAFVWIGDLQYELIDGRRGSLPDVRPDASRTTTRCGSTTAARGCPTGRRTSAAGSNEQPYAVVMEGASGDDLKFLFLDTRDLLGHYLEYTWMTDASWERVGGR